MNEERENIIIKRILSKGTQFSAPDNLMDIVMAACRAGQSLVTSYRPVIPAWCWWILGLAFTGLIIFGHITDSPGKEYAYISEFMNGIISFISNGMDHLGLILVSTILVLGVLILNSAIQLNRGLNRFSS